MDALTGLVVADFCALWLYGIAVRDEIIGMEAFRV